ncbi:unnamed protein product [Owenia fusiformis]|uniref:Uncharacterized protein n=1 Tax=Owenia fusiformis TaxID=6347 RepID=A0A8J1TD43_OWEFU|nr:unnamed protein product [Owenia fusiformis]
MSDPQKSDITAIFKRLRSITTNKQCFDCQANNPTWASVTYGVFLCIDCSATHRSLGVHLTFIRSTQLDTSWTWPQLRAMQVGGNANATAFFRQHGCNTSDSQQKYHSRTAKLYKEKLHSLAQAAMRQYGTQVHINTGHDVSSPSATTKDVDFFKEHASAALFTPQSDSTAPPVNNGSVASNNGTVAQPIQNGNLKKEENGVNGQGPCVEAALSTSPTEAVAKAEPRKSTIGARKPAAVKKSGLGGKKSKFGAQKVKTNFDQLESEAQMRDQAKEDATKEQIAREKLSEEEQIKSMASMKLAYQDMSQEKKKAEDKIRLTDPKKAAQLERLGMGFAGGKGVSHSAITDMQTIDQEKPSSGRERSGFDRYSSNKSRDFFDDEFEFVSGSGFNSGPPKYDSPFGKDKGADRDDRFGGGFSSSKWDSADRFEKRQNSSEDMPHKEKDDYRSKGLSMDRSSGAGDRSGRSRKTYDPPSESTDAQKKFGSAKAISSDAYFGDTQSKFERERNMSRFEGSNSISSDDYFGTGAPRRTNNYDNGPDLADIKDGVRQGVTKVAGRLSNIANGVINSLQDKYGN